MPNAALTGNNGCNAQEKQVAAWDERIGGRTVGRLFRIHCYRRVGQRISAKPADERSVEEGERNARQLGNAPCHGGFLLVFLSVGKGKGLYLCKVLLCPEEAGG